jgi:hypothetical protein
MTTALASALAYLDRVKDSTFGVIVLGAIGSLLATLLAFAMKYFVDRYDRMRKASSWEFGWMSSFCERSPKNIPIYITYLISRSIKLVFQCTLSIWCIIISVGTLNVLPNLSYLISLVFLSLGLLFVMLARSDYKAMKSSYQWWIDKYDQEDRKFAIDHRQKSRQPST